MGGMDEIKLFSGSSNLPLAEKIAEYINVKLGKMELGRFADGEVNVRIGETVRGYDVFLVQSTNPPVNENLMELLIMIDAFKRASARSVVAVIPYYGYARQDRKARGRDPISAKLVANLLTTAGASRIITMDLHSEQIQGFFDIPLDNLQSFPIFLEKFKSCDRAETVVVSPDIGGVKRASKFAEKLGVSLAILDKRRPKDNVAEIVNFIGDVEGKIAIIFDDIIDTARSLVESAKVVERMGAKKIIACATHALFSGEAIERIMDSPIEKVYITDTIHHENLPDKFEILTISRLFGETIMRIVNNLSVSILFR